MRLFILLISLLLASPALSATYYVRTDGGTDSQCDGLTDAPYSSGSDCAWNHPFEALPPGGTARISGGDTLIIGNGSYRMGHTIGTYDSESCHSAWPWDCKPAVIPSGTLGATTKIVGEDWETGCASMPELYGVERTSAVIDASNDYIEIQCLDITDHDQCIRYHGATGPEEGRISCPSSYPYGDWALRGVEAHGADNLLLKNVAIHGISNDGLYTSSGGSNWTLDNVDIHHNGWSGWDGGAYTGDMIIRDTSFSYNGCGETYPGGDTIGCWSQEAGGYGDAIGMTSTAGNWIFTDTKFLYNTSDGLDLLYVDANGTVALNRVYGAGNAGNQLKISGSTLSIANSIAIGNCGYFKGQPFDYAVDNCRALGHPIALNLQPGGTADIVNVSMYGEGDGLFNVAGANCNGTEILTMRNIVGVGDTDYFQPTEKSAYLWTQCAGLTIDHDYEYFHNLKSGLIQITGTGGWTESAGNHSYYIDPEFAQASTNSDSFNLTLQSSSPAINSGLAIGAVVGVLQVPVIDYLQATRVTADMGAYEFGGILIETTPTHSAFTMGAGMYIFKLGD